VFQSVDFFVQNELKFTYVRLAAHSKKFSGGFTPGLSKIGRRRLRIGEGGRDENGMGGGEGRGMEVREGKKALEGDPKKAKKDDLSP
jgi:hypothetical protein